MSTVLNLTPASATPSTACRDRAADECFGLPDWLYRSEAFAEDLPGTEAPMPLPAQAQRPRRSQRLGSGALYLATLVLALASTVPTTWLLA